LIVVIDSGVWISAIQFGGVPAEALELVTQIDDIAICAGIEKEVLHILEQKFDRDPETIRIRKAPFWNSAIRVKTTGEVKGISRDPNNDFVIECAVRARAHILISGDNDLLTLGTYKDCRILTARQYLTERRPV
jgi:uncharacterized protein